MTDRLTINGVTVATDKQIVNGISFAINDLKDISATKAAKTLPIEILGTPGVGYLFNFVFEPGSAGTSFNPNKKLPAVYYKNDVPFFIGTIQLLEANVEFVGNAQYTKYRLFMTGKNADVFIALATSKLTDIDWSDLDHTLTVGSDKFPTQWNETSPNSYNGRICYPFIDYGATGIPQTNSWTFERLKPAVFAREYWQRIFDYAGKRFTSNFLDSSYYKRVIVPCNTQGNLQNNSEPLTNYQVVAERSGTLTGTPVAASFIGGNVWRIANNYTAWLEPISIPTESIDPANAYDTSTFIWSCQNEGKYIFSGTLNFSVNIFVSDNSSQVTSGAQGIKFELGFYKREGAGPWTLAYSDFPSLLFFDSAGGAGINKTYSQTYSLDIESPEIYCTTSSEVRFVLRQSTPGDVNVVNVSTGTVTTRIDTLDATQLNVNASSFDLIYGDDVVMQETIPQNVSMLDFITSIMRHENLMMEVDPDDEDNYFIEPRNSFFDQGVNEWDSKWDSSSGLKVRPMSSLDFKKYNLKFTPDSDKYSLDYTQRTGKGYGDYVYEVDNDFIKDEKNVSVIFSPCIMVGSFDTTIVAMRFYKDSSNVGLVTPIKTNIRMAYWTNSTPCTPTTFNFNGGSYVITSYPLAASVDNPYAPTLDLNFGQPDLLYIKFNGTYTNNNRGNAQYLDMLNEISDRDSKEITTKFRLTETDIYNFTFRKLVNFGGNYYYCNLINNFNPEGGESTEVVLFKLNPSTAFSPESVVTLGSGIIIGLGENGNYNSNGGISIGSGNFNNGGIVIGDNNFIGNGVPLNLDEYAL